MAKKNRTRTDDVIDCACVIHGSGYSWDYVQNLHAQLTRHHGDRIRLHVYTEHDRSVPPHLVKHCLEEWPGISGPKKSWWYKMQLFNDQHHAGPLLYFDLDVIVLRDIDWVRELNLTYFWAIRDFRYLQRSTHNSVNSSVMYWDTRRFGWVWREFAQANIEEIVRRTPGDQDYITRVIDHNQRRYFDQSLFESYRWQSINGGYDFKTRTYRQPGAGFAPAGTTSVVVFHGTPKPHEIRNDELTKLWMAT
jgi:hypothetical protein